MKKPVVDYREFRLTKLNDPRFSHLIYLLGWIGYFIMFILTENLIPQSACTPIHCPLDDLIPFCEIFIIPYVAWYFLIFASLLYFAFYNPENFKRLQIFFIVAQTLAMAIYILFPSCQNLRPEQMSRENILTSLTWLIYSVDTNTGVCPSLHCALSIGIASIWLKEKSASISTKVFIITLCIAICLSTVFIKQHSALDFFAALPVCLLAEAISCKDYWARKLYPATA